MISLQELLEGAKEKLEIMRAEWEDEDARGTFEKDREGAVRLKRVVESWEEEVQRIERLISEEAKGKP